MKGRLLVLAPCIALAACGGATSTSDAGASDSGVGDTGTDTDAGPPRLVINEIAGASDDWVELRNDGTSSVALEGWRLTDDMASAPNLGAAVSFAVGDVLAPGEYVVVVGDFSPPALGRQSMCLSTGVPSCYQASWNITSGGDVVYLLPPGSDTPVDQVDYPGTVTAAQTWSRLPDGSGSFAVGRPTPGATNSAP